MVDVVWTRGGGGGGDSGESCSDVIEDFLEDDSDCRQLCLVGAILA